MTHWNSLEDALHNGYGIERSFLCHVHGDNTPSASVNSLNYMWVCYACGAGGKVDPDNIEYDPYALKRQLDDLERRAKVQEVSYSESWLNIFDSTGPGEYWLSRYPASLCRKHRLGQTPDGLYATIPLRDNGGGVRGVIRRSLTGQRPKYRYPFGAKLSQRMYNYHRADSDVILITEGATDAIAVDEVRPGISMSLYGMNVSATQSWLLRRYAPRVILVATDQDRAGERALDSMNTAMGDFCPVIRLTWSDYKDLASIPVDDRADLIHWVCSEYGLDMEAKVG